MNFNAHKFTKSSRIANKIIKRFSLDATFTNEDVAATSFLKHTWSFDDGHVDLLKLADEFFNPAGVKFRFFICPHLIDLWEIGEIERVKSALIDPDANLLSWKDINYLISCGHFLGSHGLDHKDFSTLSTAQAVAQFRRSQELLNERTDQWVDTFAFPFGRVDKDVKIVIESGLTYYRRLYFSDNRQPIASNGTIINRRHAEVGPELVRGICAGGLSLFRGSLMKK